MKPLHQCKLYAFIDTAYLHGRSVQELAQDLCEGGADLIQFRAKSVPANEVLVLARQILPVTRRFGVGLVINDHLQIAREVGAEYCHLGQEDFFDTGYRQVTDLLRTGDTLKIGLSSHAPEQAKAAMAAGAAYLGVGPVFATGTKPGATPVTVEYVRWAAKNVTIPWFAIGGINLENLATVIEAGAERICVVSAILNSADVKATTHAFRSRL